MGRQMLLTVHKHVVVKVPRFSVSHDNQKTWLLHISSVQQDDRGYYMCQVNTNPMISQVGFLQVVGKCRFTPIIFASRSLFLMLNGSLSKLPRIYLLTTNVKRKSYIRVAQEFINRVEENE